MSEVFRLDSALSRFRGLRIGGAVDVGESPSYVATAMNLLLLLSALLSALTGVAGGARAVEPQAVAERVIASQAATPVAATTQRPAHVVEGLAATAWARVALPPEPMASAPLYQQRRRE